MGRTAAKKVHGAPRVRAKALGARAKAASLQTPTDKAGRRAAPNRARLPVGPRARTRHDAEFRPKAKVSVAIDRDLLDWAVSLAQRQHSSLSALVNEGLELARRRYDLSKLLEHLGGTDDITDEDRAQVDAEFRAAGLIP